MIIRRQTLERFKAGYSDLTYRSDHPPGDVEVTMFFQSDRDPESRRYLSEDYWFCRKVGALRWAVL
jgi:hypothetical protein